MDNAIFPATRGAGPLLQRDYWALLADCSLTPAQVMDHVRGKFCSLPPAALVEFSAPDGVGREAELEILIKPAQRCGVRVIHDDAQSLTLGTLAGHPEAGRITFGAYRNSDGAIIFHIRSRARSTTALKRLGFLFVGDAMQTNTWADFLRNTAASLGSQIAGVIHADTELVDELPEDDEPLQSPTFLAVGN